MEYVIMFVKKKLNNFFYQNVYIYKCIKSFMIEDKF